MKQYILEAKNISKTFGNVKALENVNFYLRKGKIHGLLGENGAGKSSLMNILSGIYQPEKGSIFINNVKQKSLDPESASELGIGMVHQEFRLIESFSIEDNLTLSKSNIYQNNFKEAYEKYSEIFSLSVKPEKTISQLSVGEKQKIEIMKLIFNDSKIMLLDEPTAVLTPQETDQLRISLGTLSEEDEKTIVLISHKLKEIREFTEKVFVMKNGKMVAEELSTKDVTDDNLIELMMGNIQKSIIDKSNTAGDTKLSVKSLEYVDKVNNFKILDNINLEIKAGEIIGIAGVSGNGQVELANIISGIEVDYSGKILINNKDVSRRGVRSRKKLNLSYIPENRLGVGLAPGVSVLDNSIVRDYFKTRLGPHLSRSKTENYLESLINKFSIKAPNSKAEISTLSGGNMQKLLMGRELISNPEVIIASQPTRGLDVNAVEAIHNLLVEQRDKGSAILMISEDLDELFKLSNRIHVMFEGKIVKSFNIDDADINNVGLAMAGIVE
ncbi:ABC transporter ATP-binding protein [Acidimicrobiaceae bacterium]|nr:ABC transporter ATP-binding protein [Acidimicrobiaceae bacterium]|tara:strand:- start:1997 stop:3493 length:1497 start_codon:yes stop_codon:yes gene_type:complete